MDPHFNSGLDLNPAMNPRAYLNVFFKWNLEFLSSTLLLLKCQNILKKCQFFLESRKLLNKITKTLPRSLFGVLISLKFWFQSSKIFKKIEICFIFQLSIVERDIERERERANFNFSLVEAKTKVIIQSFPNHRCLIQKMEFSSKILLWFLKY